MSLAKADGPRDIRSSGGMGFTQVMNRLLMSYLGALAQHPLRTKALTAGLLNGLQELTAQVVARHLDRSAKSNPQQPPHSESPPTAPSRPPIDIRVLKMALYGLLVSGPLNHYLFELLGRAFAGRQGKRYLVGQLLVANLCIGTILNTASVVANEVIAGRQQPAQIRSALQRRLPPILKMSWTLFPLVQLSAHRYLPQLLWVPYFNFVGFLFGVGSNTAAKLSGK